MKTKLLTLLWVVLLGFALCAGLYGRFYALGSRPLAVDEYYFVSSVHLILAKGVPEYDLGGYYVRSLPVQYLTAASVLVFGDNGFAYRWPSALLGLLSLMLTYRYCRCHLGPMESLAVAAAVMVSAWEIEFSRFARMYIPLQCVTLGFLIALSRSLDQVPRPWSKYTLNGLALLAVLIHPLAIVLMPLLFLPVLRDLLNEDATGDRMKSLRAALFPAVVSVAGTAYAFAAPKLDRIGVADRLPDDFVNTPSRLFVAPAFPFLNLDPSAVVAWILLPCIVVIFGAVVWAGMVPAHKEQAQIGLLGLLLLASVLHQFALAALILGTLQMRFRTFRRSSLKQPWVVGLAAASGGAMLFWLFLALSWPQSLLAAAPLDWPKAFRLTFLGWPDFYQPFVEPWLRSIPLLSMLLGLSLLWQAKAYLRQPLTSILSNPIWPFVSFLFFVGIFQSTYHTTRYSFFLYPSVLCLIVIALKDLVGKYARGRSGLVVSCGFLALFALSGEFQPGQAFGIVTDSVSFRTNEYERLKDHWFRRNELQSPANYLNSLTDPSQPLIVSESEHELPFYLKRPFALYLSRDELVFRLVAREKGTRDKWSGARLLTSPEEIRAYVGLARTVWLTRYYESWNRPFEIDEIWGGELESADVMYTSRDGRIEIVRVTLHQEGYSGPIGPPRLENKTH